MRTQTGLIVGILLLATLVVALPMDQDPTPAAPPSQMRIWEAYARGYATLTTSLDQGGSPIMIDVENSGPAEVIIDERALLLSPHPLGDIPDVPGFDDETQDGVLTATDPVPPGSTQRFFYGSGATANPPILDSQGNPIWGVGSWGSNFPPWWCTEDSEFTSTAVQIALGGEILPFPMQAILDDPSPALDLLPPGDVNTNRQHAVWDFLRANDAAVVGKTPLWVQVPEDGSLFTVTIAVTNLGFWDANQVTVVDTIPPDYTGHSFIPDPVDVVTLPDGSTEVVWEVSVDAAVETDFELPTEYTTEFLTYTLEIPPTDVPQSQSPLRVPLPRVTTDWERDGTDDAHSAEPILEIYSTNDPPVAHAGGPYIGVEGSPLVFDATASTDPDGDPLQYRWDFDGDGTWDTGWSSDPTATQIYGDDYAGTLAVQVSDGQRLSEAEATLLILNADPVILVAQVEDGDEGESAQIFLSLTDPGWLDTHTATVDWGDGTSEALTVVKQGADPDAMCTATGAHVYGDNGVFDITFNVTDDDGGTALQVEPIQIANVAPTIEGDIQVAAAGNLTLRVAGEKFHDVVLTLYADGTEVAVATVLRVPGNPDEQAATIDDVTINLLGDTAWSARVVYTPLDDVINGQVWGADPAWLIFTLPTGEEARLHHTFNVRHKDTWVWEIPDLAALLQGLPLNFQAAATDPGSDDLTFTWSWGDGTPDTVTTYYNDGVGPDPFPSPDVNPMAVTDVASHQFAIQGTVTLVLTVEDDDGGVTTFTLTLDL